MKKKYLILFILFPILLNAQDVSKSIGFRGGESWGLNFRMFSEENKAAEALLSFRDGGMQFTVMQEDFMPVLLRYSDHLFLYKGYGAHLGYSRQMHDFYDKGNDLHSYHWRSFPLLGVDGLIGLEYRFFKYPFTAGIDFKPFAELGGRRFFRLDLWDFACTIRYSFN